MTPAGHTALETELKHLKSEERPAIIRAIAEAREHGDLSENAEYHSAREKQSFIEGRIKELEGVLSLSEVINPATLSGTIKFGATVTLVDEDTDALQAMATSWEMMGGAKLQMFKINACMGILTFGGMLLCFVGMIPVIMVWALVPVVVYEQLRQSRLPAPSAPEPEPYPNIES